MNDETVCICKARLQGFYPIYLPQDSVLDKNVIFTEYKRSLHRGVANDNVSWQIIILDTTFKTLIKVNNQKLLWVYKIQKSTIPFSKTSTTDQIELKNVSHFKLQSQTMRDKLNIKPKRKVTSKHLSYNFIATQLEPYTQNQYPVSLHRIYSDSAKTLKAGPKWLANINKDQNLHNFLSSQTIIWKFNVFKAPQWDGQFEWITDLIKESLYRTNGKAQLSWAELEEVLPDMAIILNTLLTYTEG